MWWRWWWRWWWWPWPWWRWWWQKGYPHGVCWAPRKAQHPQEKWNTATKRAPRSRAAVAKPTHASNVPTASGDRPKKQREGERLLQQPRVAPRNAAQSQPSNGVATSNQATTTTSKTNEAARTANTTTRQILTSPARASNPTKDTANNEPSTTIMVPQIEPLYFLHVQDKPTWYFIPSMTCISRSQSQCYTPTGLLLHFSQHYN